MQPDDFRDHGNSIVDWIARYFVEVEGLPVLSRTQPGDLLRKLPPTCPETGVGMGQILEDFEREVLDGITHWNHPSFFGFFPANNSGPSILGEFLTAGIGAQCMVWKTSPAAAELEERTLEWLRDLLGLPQTWSGVIQDTASTATLCALLTARERATDWSTNRDGLAAHGRRLTVYASEEIHSSIPKAVRIAGLGEANLRSIETDAHLAMRPDRLEAAIEADRAAGLTPCCIVACLGTTATHAFDDLAAIGEIARRHGVWLHVDAAMAGTAAMLPECRWMHAGVDAADSYVFNPHKWMFTNFDLSAYYVREPALLTRTFEIHPEYLRTDVDREVKNYRDWGIPLGRRFRALKLWFVLRYYGAGGIREKLRHHLTLAETFRDWVDEAPAFERMNEAPLNLICFRFVGDAPTETPPERIDAWNETLLHELNASGELFLTHCRIRGRYALRMSIGQTNTTDRHVADAWRRIRETAERSTGNDA